MVGDLAPSAEGTTAVCSRPSSIAGPALRNPETGREPQSDGGRETCVAELCDGACGAGEGASPPRLGCRLHSSAAASSSAKREASASRSESALDSSATSASALATASAACRFDSAAAPLSAAADSLASLTSVSNAYFSWYKVAFAASSALACASSCSATDAARTASSRNVDSYRLRSADAAARSCCSSPSTSINRLLAASATPAASRAS